MPVTAVTVGTEHQAGHRMRTERATVLRGRQDVGEARFAENRAFTLRFSIDPTPAERTVRRIEEIKKDPSQKAHRGENPLPLRLLRHVREGGVSSVTLQQEILPVAGLRAEPVRSALHPSTAMAR